MKPYSASINNNRDQTEISVSRINNHSSVKIID